MNGRASPSDRGSLLDFGAVLLLNVRVPGEPARRIRLERPAVTLGRSSTNDIPLSDRTLSRVHARLEQLDGGLLRVVDLGSRNGTMVNSIRIADPLTLKPGDRIQLGETVIDVIEESTTRVVIDAKEDDSLRRTTFLQSSKDLMRPHREESGSRLGAEELARLNASLRILNEVSVELLSDMPLPRLFELILEKVFAYLQPDRGLLMLADEKGELRPEQVKFAEGIDPSDIRLSKTLVQTVVDRKNGVLVIDTATDGQLAAAESIRIQGITSCMAAPLFVDDQVIGLIYLEVRLGRKSFMEEDLRLLTSLANTAAVKIQNLRLRESSVARERFERDMSLAWDIQRRLLPEARPGTAEHVHPRADRPLAARSPATTTISSSAPTGRSTLWSPTSAGKGWGPRSSRRRSRPPTRPGRARSSCPTASARG